MNDTSFRDAMLTLASVAVLLALLRSAAEIVVPFLLSLFIAILAASPVDQLRQRGFSRLGSVLTVLTALVVAALVLGLLLGRTATQFNEALPGYQARLVELVNKASSWLEGRGIDVEDSGILSAVDPSVALGFANGFVLGIGDAVKSAMVILFIVLFMLVEASGFSRKMMAMSDDPGGRTLQRIADMVRCINRYASAKFLVSLATGVLIWIGLELVGLDFAPLWGFVAFLLNFVPNIGSLLAAVPAVLVAMLQLEPAMVLVVVAIYVIINTVIGSILEPMIMGQRVGLSGLTVFLSLLFWGWMFGPVGMLLSVPLSMVVKFAAQATPQTQWVAVLLSPAPPAEKMIDKTNDKKGRD